MVADIARELHMSPANVYRFFAAKSEINEAVCMDLLGKIEAEAEKIAGLAAPPRKEYATCLDPSKRHTPNNTCSTASYTI